MPDFVKVRRGQLHASVHACRQLHQPNVDPRPKLTEICRPISTMPMIIRNNRTIFLINLAGQNTHMAVRCGREAHVAQHG